MKVDTDKLISLSKFVLEYENRDAVVSLNFVSEEEIYNLNKTYRDVDAPTDVLSFESDIDGDLGDIFICIEVAEKNVKKYNTTIKNELNLLVVHGCLHLCGYDHISKSEASVMEAREEEILDA